MFLKPGRERGGLELGVRLYFAEIHALDTFASQRGAHGRRGRGLPGADYQLDDLIF